MIQASPADGGAVSVHTVMLALIALASLLGPGILALITSQAARAAKDREDAREERLLKAQADATAKTEATARLAAERDAKQVASMAEIHSATNSQLSKLQADLEASRRETKAAMDKTMELLSAQAAAPPPLAVVTNGRESEALPQGPIAVYTVPGSQVEVAANEPVPVVVSDGGTKP